VKATVMREYSRMRLSTMPHDDRHCTLLPHQAMEYAVLQVAGFGPSSCINLMDALVVCPCSVHCLAMVGMESTQEVQRFAQELVVAYSSGCSQDMA